MNWADCSCCWPQKPFIRKAVGWTLLGSRERNEPDEEVPPFWYYEVGGWPRGHYDTWEAAMRGAGRYLERER